MSTPTRKTWTEALSAAERVRTVALSLGEPRTANWVASEAEVAHETARKYLSQLESEGQLETVTVGEQTGYRPDPVGGYLGEMRELFEAHTPTELAASLERMNEEIRDWQAEFGVETPNELRASIVDASTPELDRERQRIASEWEHLAYRRSLVSDALRLHDRFPGEPRRASV